MRLTGAKFVPSLLNNEQK